MTKMFAHAVATGGFIGGANVQAFQEQFAAFCEVKHCLGAANGTDALMLALRALEIGRRRSCCFLPIRSSPPQKRSICGSNAGLVDVMPDSHTMDPEALAQLTSDKIKAVMPVHIYGQAACRRS